MKAVSLIFHGVDFWFRIVCVAEKDLFEYMIWSRGNL